MRSSNQEEVKKEENGQDLFAWLDVDYSGKNSKKAIFNHALRINDKSDPIILPFIP